MIIVAIGLLELIFGSFVNAFVWRLHEQAELEGKKGKAAAQRRRDLSIAQGRSMCPHCGHTLAARDLVPVFSWLSLGGKCRYCRAPISWQYPLVELLTAGLFAWSYAAWPLRLDGPGIFQLICWLVFLVAFVALAIYDFRWYLLPDRVVAPLMVLALVQVAVVAIWSQRFAAVWQPALGAVLISGLFWALLQVSKGAWIGGGWVLSQAPTEKMS